jgi:hypothetical protein
VADGRIDVHCAAALGGFGVPSPGPP